MSNRQDVGREAENLAASHLMNLGYVLVTRNYRTRGGEIDLICLDGDTLVFVEVKGRLAAGYVPEEGIGEKKVAAMQRAAESYLAAMNETRAHRFDVIAIDRSGLRHHKHIFNH